MTEFQVTEFHKKFISWVHGHPNIPANIQEISQQIVFVTKIHGEFHSHIILHTNTITNNLEFYMGFFLVTALLAKLTKTSTRRLWRLLPGGPSSPEESTVGPSILSYT